MPQKEVEQEYDNTDDMQDIYALAIKRFNTIISACEEERENCISDRRFCSIRGGQWESAWGEQFANKPKLEINKTQLSCLKIINEYLNNSIDVSFIPRDNNDALADACTNIMRSDEADSNADEAFDSAFWDAVTGGMGGWRLATKYNDDDDEQDETQRIIFEPTPDSDKSIFFDNGSIRADKSDAGWGFVLKEISKEDYEEQFNDDISTWDNPISQTLQFDWGTNDTVTIAEYYVKEQKKEKILYYKGAVGDDDIKKVYKSELTNEYKKELKDTGYKLEKTRTVEKTRIHKYLLSGNSILEDCGYIVGNSIPVIVNFGKRCFIDGIERIEGHVRLARDAQVIKNVQMSKLTEIASYSAVEKPIFSPEQMVGHAQDWADDNIKNNPYLLINRTYDANGQIEPAYPLGYTKPPQIPPALVGLLQSSEQDMQDILGNPQTANEVQANTSGLAIELVQSRLDMNTFIYMSNMAKARKRTAEIWLEMAKEVYVEDKRRLKSIDKGGKTNYITLNEPTIDEKTQQILYTDLRNAKLDVKVTIGATSASKRSATVRALSQMMQLSQDPELQQVLGLLAILNMEGEGLEDARGFFRQKAIRMGIIKPSEEEAQELQAEAENQQPSEQDKYLQALSEQATADASSKRANTIKTLADADKSKAETAKTITEIKSINVQDNIDIASQVIQALQGSTSDVPVEQIPAGTNINQSPAVALQ